LTATEDRSSPLTADRGHASETNLKGVRPRNQDRPGIAWLVPTASERHSSRLVPIQPQMQTEKVIRSDARKLTACREVAGFYKPSHAKSRLINIAEAPVLQTFLAFREAATTTRFAPQDRLRRIARRPVSAGVSAADNIACHAACAGLRPPTGWAKRDEIPI